MSKTKFPKSFGKVSSEKADVFGIKFESLAHHAEDRPDLPSEWPAMNSPTLMSTRPPVAAVLKTTAEEREMWRSMPRPRLSMIQKMVDEIETLLAECDALEEKLRVEQVSRRHLQELAACCYQFAGCHHAPIRWLDALSAASDGEKFVVDNLLPYLPEDLDPDDHTGTNEAPPPQRLKWLASRDAEIRRKAWFDNFRPVINAIGEISVQEAMDAIERDLK